MFQGLIDLPAGEEPGEGAILEQAELDDVFNFLPCLCSFLLISKVALVGQQR